MPLLHPLDLKPFIPKIFSTTNCRFASELHWISILTYFTFHSFLYIRQKKIKNEEKFSAT